MGMGTSRLKLAGGIAIAAMIAMGQAHAGVIPYPNIGTENPILYSFTAASTGDVIGYFFHQDAGYTNEITMLVNGVPTGNQGLNNHTSVHGDMLDLGAVTVGDSVVFELVNIAPGGVGPWYSDKSRNTDAFNHIYSTDFAGDLLIPAGIYIGFEDL
jgi:hypothetical protein